MIAELQRRHATSIHADISQALESISEQPTLRAVLKVVVKTVVKEHQSAPEVHKAISEELPLSQRSIQDDKGEMLKQMLNVLQPLMKNVPDPELATYMVGISMQAIVHQVTSQRPELLSYSSLVEEMVTLIVRFLIRD